MQHTSFIINLDDTCIPEVIEAVFNSGMRATAIKTGNAMQ